ncbi:MAG: thioredoxin domain-containing protein [Deltaproteobacteria bacterium]|nr:thioredoxin domain-containing protein [Deltaproteobacteria bacterium]
MSHLVFRRFLLMTVVVVFTGCRSPLKMDEEVYGEFDASAYDAGPQPEGACNSNDSTYSFNNSLSPYFGGDESIKAEVVDFSSFYCSHCADFAEDVHTLWSTRPDIQEKVRFYFHHTSTSWRHLASVAAQNQGMEHFWAVHDFIYVSMREEYTSGPSEEEITEFVRDTLKLDMDRFEADIADQKTAKFINWDKEQGEKAGVQGTPTVFVCGEKVDRSQLESVLDEHL